MRLLTLETAAHALPVVEFVDEVGSAYPAKFTLDGAALFRLVPEEEHALGKLLFLSLGAEDRLQGVRIVPRIPGLGRNGHRSRGEILHLFQMKVQSLRNDGKFGHVFFMTARMRTDEVRNDLLVQTFFLVDLVEDALELVEEVERWLAHELQNLWTRMFRSYLQSAAHVLGNQFARVFSSRLIHLFVLALMQQKVVTHTTTNETLLDSRQSIYSMINLQKLAVVGIEVRTNLRVYTRRALAHFAGFLILAVHSVHVGRRTAQIAQIALEIRHLDDFLHLLQNALLAAANHEFTLMGRNGAERTAAETATMKVHGELDHLVGRNGLALVFRMRQTRIRQVESRIQFRGSHQRERRIHHYIFAVNFLNHALSMHFVGFFLQMAHVLSLSLLVVETFFVAVEDDVIVLEAARNLILLAVENHLRHFVDLAKRLAFCKGIGQFNDRTFAHSVENEVGARIAENALAELVFPIVVVADAAQRSLNTA